MYLQKCTCVYFIGGHFESKPHNFKTHGSFFSWKNNVDRQVFSPGPAISYITISYCAWLMFHEINTNYQSLCFSWITLIYTRVYFCEFKCHVHFQDLNLNPDSQTSGCKLQDPRTPDNNRKKYSFASTHFVSTFSFSF